jgi:predicted fused transcriptional regulator/phosphomethylpyrimidine kinase
MQGSIEGKQCGARSQMAKNFVVVFDLKKHSRNIMNLQFNTKAVRSSETLVSMASQP